MKAKNLWSALIAVVLVAAVAFVAFNGTDLSVFSTQKQAQNVDTSVTSAGVALKVVPVEFEANAQTMKVLRKNGLILKSNVLTPMVNQKSESVFIEYTGNSVVDSELKELARKASQL